MAKREGPILSNFTMISGLILIFRHPHKEHHSTFSSTLLLQCTFPKFPKFNSLRITKLILKATEEPDAASESLTFGSKSYYSGLNLVTGPNQLSLRSGYDQTAQCLPLKVNLHSLSSVGSFSAYFPFVVHIYTIHSAHFLP